MSDESKPRPFRLKPRLPADDQEAATTDATPPEPATGAEAQSETKSKFRLKPRLAPVPETSDNSSSQEDEKPKPVLSDETAGEKSETSRTEPVSEAPAPTPLSAAHRDFDPTQEGYDDMLIGSLEDTVPPTPPASSVAPVADEVDDAGLEEDEAPAKKSSSRLLVGLLALIIIGGGGYYGWQHFMGAEPPPAPPVDATPAKSASQPTIQAKAETTAEDLMAKAKAMAATGGVQDPELVAAVMGDQSESSKKPAPPLYRRPSAFGRIQPVAADHATAAVPANTQPEAHAAAQPGSTAELEESRSRIAPDVTATTSAVMATVEASDAFRDFVGAARINGVFQGSPARALINGHTYREGAVVDPALGIVFDHVEAAEKVIIFKDESGAIVRRRY